MRRLFPCVCWLLACGSDGEGIPAVTVQPLPKVTDEPGCYQERGHASTEPAASVSGCDATLTNLVTTFSGHAFALPSGAEPEALVAEGTVAGDTGHGWAPPSPLAARKGIWLREVSGVGPRSGVEGVTELLLEYRSEARGLVDLKGQRVRLVVNQVEFSGSEQWSRAVVLRTMGGQLLVASIHGAIDEYFAEGLPELRAQISGERGTPVTRQCSGANGSITSVPASLQLRSLNETKVFAGCTRGGLAIGCVAYLVATGRVEEITKMEIKQLPCAIDPPLEFEVARTGILER